MLTWSHCKGCDLPGCWPNGYCSRCWEEVEARSWEGGLPTWAFFVLFGLTLLALVIGVCYEFGG